jgi:hypothetical protein
LRSASGQNGAEKLELALPDRGSGGTLEGPAGSLFGLVKESFAASGAIASAKSDAAANPLIKAVVAEFETSEGPPPRATI